MDSSDALSRSRCRERRLNKKANFTGFYLTEIMKIDWEFKDDTSNERKS